MKDHPDTPRTDHHAPEEATASSGGPSRRTRPSANRRTRKPAPPRTLIETRGPDPTAPLANVRLTVGRLGGSHGVRGEIKMRVLTDEPEHLKKVKKVFLGERDQPIGLQSVRFVHDGMLIKLAGYDTPEDVSKLSGLDVKIAGTDARPLEDGEYFLFQLIGLKAEDEQGTPLGTVTDLMETGAHDVLVIGNRPDSPQDLLVPNHPEFVKDMRVSEGRIILAPPVWDD